MTVTTAERSRRKHQSRATCILQLSLLLISIFHITRALSPLSNTCRIGPHNKQRSLFMVDPSNELLSNVSLNKRLEKYGFSKRLVTIEASDLPVVAEVHHEGKWSLGKIICFQLPTRQGNPPRVQVRLEEDKDPITMDFGQITTIWRTVPSKIAPNWRKLMETELDRFPGWHADHVMLQLYSDVDNQKSGGGGLTKRAVSQIIESTPEEERVHTEQVLRKLVKTGKGMARLVDSSVAAAYLFTNNDNWVHQAVGGHVLAMDSELGGRFKRMSCTAVSFQLVGDSDNIQSVSFVNGGWLVLDQGVRAVTEARKFAERTDGPLRTVADERIVHRLECLAMGQVFASPQMDEENDRELELDVREALKALDLPISPSGAQDALLRIGRWTKVSKNIKIEPWSKDTLDAASWYANMDAERRTSFKDTQNDQIEGRLDLTKIPCVCIDAERTAFRDDAIGIRPRAMTGRNVDEEASKWEVMVHIADVSDIYTSHKDSRYTSLLQEAATNRGMSRYDLPLGPLHLLPPVALRALSLHTIKADSFVPKSKTTGVNRCVTLWAYINERTGKIIDAGVERTLVSLPIALSFSEATALLETNPQLDPREPLMLARSIISVADRILSGWTSYQTQNNSSAKKREDRLAVRELVANEYQHQGSRRDDGSNGFQRSRGHRLVDAVLDLHGFTLLGLLRKSKAPIPMASGTKDGGRVGTAPLRRFVDGMVQRQALSVLCNFGGPPLTTDDCHVVNEQMDQARNMYSNFSATKGRMVPTQTESLRALQAHLVDRSSHILSALSTGRENEVVIEGIGAIAKCQGLKGSLKPGEKVSVTVNKLNAEKGVLIVTFVSK